MALEMRTACERCDAHLAADGDARICSYECTFCPACTEAMAGTCPNCGRGPGARPPRAPPPHMFASPAPRGWAAGGWRGFGSLVGWALAPVYSVTVRATFRRRVR